MNSVVFFEIQATDPVRAMEFYTSVFGWDFTKQEQVAIPYWEIETPGINGGLLVRPFQTPPPECGTNAYSCSMQVEDYDATAQKILAAGGTEALPKFLVPGKCWQGYFMDTENNTFGIFQVLEVVTV